MKGGTCADIRKLGAGEGSKVVIVYVIFHNYAVAKGSQLQHFVCENEINL